MHNIGLFLVHLGGYMFLLGAVVLWPITSYITGRYFDNELGFKNCRNYITDATILFPKSFVRTAEYTLLIIFRRAPKNSIGEFIFGDKDFWHLARLIDKIFAYTFGIMLYGGMIVMLLSAIFLGLQGITT